MGKRKSRRNKRGPGRIWYLAGLMLVFVGIAGPALPGLYRYWMQPYSREFQVPGRTEMKLAETGRYSLWYDYQTTFKGRTFLTSTNIPTGLQIVLQHKSSGRVVPMETGMNGSVKSTTSARRTVGSFEIRAPGDYVLFVSAPTRQPVVFSFRKDWLLPVLGGTLFLFVVGVPVAIAGLAMIIIVFIWRSTG